MSATRTATGINAGDPTQANLFEFLGIRLPEWYGYGRCSSTDPDAFFPEKGGSTAAAKRVCNGDPRRGTQPCPVKELCLDWAVERQERWGIWGGVSERDRRKLARARTEGAA